MTPNLTAFLSMIAASEGTAGIGDDGYNVIVGATPRQPIVFGSYRDHPRLRVQVRPGLISTAAGRYQILVRIFDHYRDSLKLPDFSPASQDAIAVQLIRECGALDDIEAGRVSDAIRKCRSRWASFPAAGYNQWEHSLSDLRAMYVQAGGQEAA